MNMINVNLNLFPDIAITPCTTEYSQIPRSRSAKCYSQYFCYSDPTLMRCLTYIRLVDRWRVQHRHPTKQGGGALTGCCTAGYGGGWRRQRRGGWRRQRRGRKKVDSGKEGNDFSASSSKVRRARQNGWAALAATVAAPHSRPGLPKM